MLLGVYITASHQGLSCPDWPLCPNKFGFPSPKYFFEHIHRMIAIIVAIVILITSLYAISNTKYLRMIAIGSGIIVLIQILLGMLIVNTKLQPLLVAAHLLIGAFLFAIILVMTVYTYSLLNPTIPLHRDRF